MKRTSVITTSLVAGMLALGLATQSSAMVGGNFELHNGNTPSRMVTGVDHYRFQVESPRQLRVTSQQWSPDGGYGHITAELHDDNGRLVARSTARGRDFLLEENLVPGRYTLKVDSSRLGGRKQATQRYYLSTEIH